MPVTTARLALPTPTLSEAADVPASMLALATALDQSGQWGQGTLAARPAAIGVTGRLYFATDEQKLYINTGTAWVSIGPSVSGIDSITAFEIAMDAVGASELANNAVDTAAIVDGAVTTAKIGALAVDTTKIAASLKPSGGAGGGTEALRALGVVVGTAAAGDDGRIRGVGTTAGTYAAGDDSRFATQLAINAQAGSYTLVIGDRNKMIEISNAGAVNLTVPLNSSVAFAVGDMIHLLQTGAGQITVAPAGGVAVNGNPGLKLNGQWASATLLKRGTDTWALFGNITT